jgi:molecular chaperone DnaJ
VAKPCGECRGRGVKLRKVVTEVRIPAGVDDGMRVRIAGEGERAPGGVAGDCYCFINIEPHPLFERQGDHLVCRVPITYSQAALGCTLEVPTLDGRDTIEVKRGTQSGDVFHLHGQGMPDPHGRGRGDLLVQVSIEVPTRLSADEEVLLRKLAEVEHKNVAPRRKSFFETLKEYFAPAHETGQEDHE